MKRSTLGKLVLSRETLRALSVTQLEEVPGATGGCGTLTNLTFGGSCKSLNCTEDLACQISNNPAVTCPI